MGLNISGVFIESGRFYNVEIIFFEFFFKFYE